MKNISLTFQVASLMGVVFAGNAWAEPIVDTPADRFVELLSTRTELAADAAELIRAEWVKCEDCDGEEFLTQGLAVVSADFRDGLDAYDGDKYAEAAARMGALTGSDDPFISTNAAVYEIKIEVAEPQILAEQLARLHGELAVELRMENPSLRHEPAKQPVATLLTRIEARSKDVLTTPLHTMLPIEPIDRAIVGFLDGTRTEEQVAAAVVEAAASGEIEIEGAPSGSARLTPLIESRVRVTVTTLGWWGLCS